MARFDSAGRDVTDLPGLWDESDTMPQSELSHDHLTKICREQHQALIAIHDLLYGTGLNLCNYTADDVSQLNLAANEAFLIAVDQIKKASKELQ